MALVRWTGGYSGSIDWSAAENDIKSEIRNLKIKILNGEFEVNFSDVNKKRHREELNFILNKLSTNDVITGSLALKLYGLLDREIGDIDILIEDENRYNDYILDYYGIRLDNRLGYKKFIEKGWFSRKEYKVDFFKNKGVTYNEMNFNGEKLKVHNPIDIINLKSKIFINGPADSNQHKHYQDLVHIFNKVNLVY